MRKASKIKISFGIIVLNGQPFLKYCLRHLYPFAHEIIVVEGGSSYNKNFITKEGHSIDGTLKALKEFKKKEDSENKVKIITKKGFWSEKDEQSQAFAKIATGDYLWQVSVDEFYKEEDIKKIIEILEKNPSITGMSFKTITFFRDIKYRVDSCYLQTGPDLFERLFKWGKGYRYAKHRPITILNAKGENLMNLGYLDGNTLAKKYGIYLYHYCMLFPFQVESKLLYHGERSKKISYKFLKKANHENVYKENFLELKPFRFHNNYKFVSWLEEYKGKQPEQPIKMMEDLKRKKINVMVKDNSDIERLLKKRGYKIIKKYFIKAYGNLELFYHTWILGLYPQIRKLITKTVNGYSILRSICKKLFKKRILFNVKKDRMPLKK